jgi:hypothetical protein
MGRPPGRPFRGVAALRRKQTVEQNVNKQSGQFLKLQNFKRKSAGL